MANKSGYLISFEGGEGGGKSTQVARLAEQLRAAGHDVVALREPGGTAVGEQIREVVLAKKNTGMAFTTEVLLFQAARAQIYAEVVIPSLKAGKIILMDRTRDSSVVYQGVVRGFGSDLIEQLNDISTQNTHPHATILLDVPVEVGLGRRVAAGDMNRLDLEDKSFHEKVRQAYLVLAKNAKPGRWHVIDAASSFEVVEKQIWEVVSALVRP